MKTKELFQLYEEKRKEIKELEKEKDLIYEQLKNLIPDNQEKDQVFHRVTYSNAVSYAKAIPEIKNLIPKTKHDELNSILDGHTKAFPRHSFKVL